MSTVNLPVTLELVGCAECGISFGVPSDYVRIRRGDHETFYCPSGHHNYYPGLSEAEKLKQYLANSRWRLAAAETAAQAARDQLQTSERRRRAEKAAKTRIKNRIANGVCPKCNRSFPDLHQHMAGQHPGFAAEPDA